MNDMTLTVTIQALPTLPNKLLGAHWRVRAGNAKKWKRLVGEALMAAVPLPFMIPLVKARITFTRCSPRTCDYDGLVGSFKVCADALVHHGVIEDDTPAHIEATYLWVKTPKVQQGIRIEVVAA